MFFSTLGWVSEMSRDIDGGLIFVVLIATLLLYI